MPAGHKLFGRAAPAFPGTSTIAPGGVSKVAAGRGWGYETPPVVGGGSKAAAGRGWGYENPPGAGKVSKVSRGRGWGYEVVSEDDNGSEDESVGYD